jgi:hypothetical protein
MDGKLAFLVRKKVGNDAKEKILFSINSSTLNNLIT